MKFLDIGVGGGRTTVHFASLTNEYIGIDYSKNMIEACEKRFSNLNKFTFKTCDVRDMSIFENNYFDFILFSFNGIDYMSHEDRLRALKEIKRIGKNNGYFFFSTHNLQYIDTLFSFPKFTNFAKMLRKMIKFVLLRLINERPNKLNNRSCSIIQDGAHRFRLKTYYVKPREQIKQLKDLGFKNIRIYSIADGTEIKNDYEIDMNSNMYLYYLCNI